MLRAFDHENRFGGSLTSCRNVSPQNSPQLAGLAPAPTPLPGSAVDGPHEPSDRDSRACPRKRRRENAPHKPPPHARAHNQILLHPRRVASLPGISEDPRIASPRSGCSQRSPVRGVNFMTAVLMRRRAHAVPRCSPACCSLAHRHAAHVARRDAGAGAAETALVRDAASSSTCSTGRRATRRSAPNAFWERDGSNTSCVPPRATPPAVRSFAIAPRNQLLSRKHPDTHAPPCAWSFPPARHPSKSDCCRGVSPCASRRTRRTHRGSPALEREYPLPYGALTDAAVVRS